MKSRHITASVTCAALLVLAAGCADGREPEPTSPGPSHTVPSASPPGTPAAPTTGEASTPAPTTAAPSATPSPPSTADADVRDALRRGDTGDRVQALQKRLDRLGYWVGETDGTFGLLTEQAVYALQKAAGLRPDGIVGAKTRAALDDGRRPDARSTGGHLAEVDLDRQLLMIVDDGEVSRIFNTSTGTFERYTHQGRPTWRTPRAAGGPSTGRSTAGATARSAGCTAEVLPGAGIAIHGYTSVPPYPASHGCVRVTLPAMDWLWAQDVLPKKTRFWVY
ncbi:peptidoglycan-binding protein [Micromonospora sp. WMMB482]|uniref:L,D-transpeptidase family protein n=1 Tax=Micromonospora sp. WMMB482 TaxID=2849653 RepID=UPI0020B2D3BE|nr:peptidoglycan-binding protein [Micromonospora sp. WMMB482]